MSAQPTRLTPEQQQQYKQQGYLLYNQPVLPAEKFSRLESHVQSLIDQWTTWSKKSTEHMDVPHFADPKLFEWLMADEVLDLIEPLIGPDIALFSSHLICKPPKVGKRVPWHEDSAYWNKRLQPMEVVTVWLAMDPSTTDNGCMRIIPGSHTNGFSQYANVDQPDRQVFGTEIVKGSFDESKAIDCVLQPNQASLHHAKIIHGSHANTGQMRRCGYTMRYMPTTVKYVRTDNDPFQIYLARGKDHAGNTYGDPTQVNQNWLDQYPEGWPSGH